MLANESPEFQFVSMCIVSVGHVQVFSVLISRDKYSTWNPYLYSFRGKWRLVEGKVGFYMIVNEVDTKLLIKN